MARTSGTGGKRRKPVKPADEPADAKAQTSETPAEESSEAGDTAEVTAAESPSAGITGAMPEEPRPEDAPAAAAVDAPDAPAEPVPTPTPTPIQPGAATTGGRLFVAALGGGLLVALLAAGGLWLAVERGWLAPGGAEDIARISSQLEEQAARIAAQETRIAAETGSTEALTSAVSALEEKLTAAEASREAAQAAMAPRPALEALQAEVTALRERLAALEVQPIPQAELPAEVAAAYDAKLAEMQSALDSRLAAIEARIEARIAGVEAEVTRRLDELSRAAETAAEAEARAEAARNRAAAAAAFARIEAALETGAPIRADLTEIAERLDLEVPAALDAVADTGAPTLDGLRRAFPDAARAALVAATREAAEAGEVDRWTAFLRTQLGARSLEPRAGDDPDAVLSRAEAALAEGDLEGALAEIDTLPEAGRAELNEWAALARTRLAALAAAETLGATIGAN